LTNTKKQGSGNGCCHFLAFVPKAKLSGTEKSKTESETFGDGGERKRIAGKQRN